MKWAGPGGGGKARRWAMPPTLLFCKLRPAEGSKVAAALLL